MTASSSLRTFSITDKDIVDYLQQHKDFFVDKLSLLADLELPHQTGGAISLVERQVSILRDRNIDMRHRLNALLDNARTNDKLFEKTKRLILNLLEAQDINDLLNALMDSFDNDFEIQQTVLLLFNERIDKATISVTGHIQVVPLKTAQEILGTIISNNQTVCGQLDTAEQQLLFQEHANRIGSTAITPLASANPLGILAIGNEDPEYYRSSMSTLFLTYIGEVLSRLLPQHLNKG
ncbi:hypothetical protein AB835_05190 [Candidatus Endobugula sertula]|uniref:Phytochrome sensor protein n=1 Tax=Candidatus Endobugula sertula TaxID=62101 RepID=A0A1D2QRC5_9GAMM|nr:hypothetical protein AB835_05190 [Candidatus Endobugula sertula]